MEQDFLKFLTCNPDLLVKTPQEADWHYLPVFWGRWHIAHEFGQTGRDELQQAVSASILDDARTFTICGYGAGPLIEVGRTVVFQVSRRGEQGIDIPLLSSRHRQPFLRPRKKYLASFIGRVATHPIRQAMFDALKGRDDVYLHDGDDQESDVYVRNMQSAWVALCPRGYGGSSFRFFEAMDLGLVPFFIGDLDARPFKHFIDWETVSLFAESADRIGATLDAYPRSELAAMGRRAQALYVAKLDYQKWCRYVFQELELLK